MAQSFTPIGILHNSRARYAAISALRLVIAGMPYMHPPLISPLVLGG